MVSAPRVTGVEAMTIAARIFAFLWQFGPMTQVGALLLVAWAYVFVSAWLRAGDSLRGTENRKVSR